jgi:predicted KAP-like P-loop ATPase
MFSPDAPIQSAKEDLLGRANFASVLTRAIVGTSGPDSFVVGIHGKWGTGKSSVMNLIVEQIHELNRSAKSDEEKLYPLRFNPWNFSDQNQLIFQFLKQFRAHMLNFQGTARKTAERVADALDEYAEALAPPLEFIPYGGKILSVLRGVRRFLGPSKEIDHIFNQLVMQSAAFKRRTIVLIDDIDRLNASEIRQVFQLVKLTARFPYVTYVLAFDRAAVGSALQERGVDSGEEYLEKIVQLSFDLPSISEATLSSFITKGLDSLLANYKPAHLDMERFGTMFHAGFRSSFTSVRHVRRFLNGLEFSLSLIGHEVNGADIIGIEALKTFYPRTFDAARSNKQLFAGPVDPLTKELGSPEYRKKLDEVLLPTNELNENLKSLLTKLFPKVEYAYSVSHTIYGDSSETEWEKTYRVATERYFDAYFQLTLAPSEVSVAELSRIIHDCSEESACVASLREIAKQGKLKATMDSLRFRLQEVRPENLPPLLGALIEIGEIASESGAVFANQIPEYWHVRWAIFDVFAQIPSEKRTDVLLEIARRVLAPKTMVNIIALLEEVRRKEDKYEEFTDERLTELKRAIAERIKRAAASGEITEAPDSLSVLLYAWRQWGDPAEPAAYVQSLTDTDDKLVRFLDKFIYQTHSTVLSEGLVKTHNRLAMKQLSESLDLNVLQKRLSHVDLRQMEEANGGVIKLVLEQLEKMREKGLTPEQFDNTRLFFD